MSPCLSPMTDLGPFWVGNVKRLDDSHCRRPRRRCQWQSGTGRRRQRDYRRTHRARRCTQRHHRESAQRHQYASDGRLSMEALTFWTDGGSLPEDAEDDELNYTDDTDGREVSRGGAGQKIPGFLAGANPGFDNATGRKVFTEPETFTAGTAASLMALDAYTENGDKSAGEQRRSLRDRNGLYVLHLHRGDGRGQKNRGA